MTNPDAVPALVAQWRQMADKLSSEGFRIGVRTCAASLEAAWQARPEPQWQPMETAPRDGTEILLSDGHYKRTGWWAKRINRWSLDSAVPMAIPTQWLPLPAAGRPA